MAFSARLKRSRAVLRWTDPVPPTGQAPEVGEAQKIECPRPCGRSPARLGRLGTAAAGSRPAGSSPDESSDRTSETLRQHLHHPPGVPLRREHHDRSRRRSGPGGAGPAKRGLHLAARTTCPAPRAGRCSPAAARSPRLGACPVSGCDTHPSSSTPAFSHLPIARRSTPSRTLLVEEVPQMAVVQMVEELPDVHLEHPAATHRPSAACQSVFQRLVRRAPRPEAVRAVQKVLLVDRFQHHRHRPLQDLVLEGRNPDRARLASRRLSGCAPAAPAAPGTCRT